MKIKNHDDFPKLDHRSAPSFRAEQDWVIDSPPIPRARSGDGQHNQLGNFQTALLGRITPAATVRGQRLSIGRGRGRRARHARPSAVEDQGGGERAKSRIRARIEHVFVTQETAPGCRILRTIGIVRARLKIGLQNLVYNIHRLAALERMATARGRSLTSATETSRQAEVAGSGPTREVGICPSAAHELLEMSINLGDP
jgi:hypothetical protein